MRTTADPRTLFREIDGTTLSDEESFTFNIEQEASSASVVKEGEEFPREELNITEVTVDLEEFGDTDEDKERAAEAVHDDASSHLAGTPIDNEYNYDTLYIDRECKNTYLVDTSRFGYKVTTETDEDGNAVEGGYVVIFADAGLQLL